MLVSWVGFFEHQMFLLHQIWCIFCRTGLYLLDYRRLLACLNVRLNVFVGAQSCGMYLDDASLLCVMPHTLNLAWCDLGKATVIYTWVSWMRYTGLVTAEVEEFFHVLWHSMLINEFLPGFCQRGSQLLTIAIKYVFSFFPWFSGWLVDVVYVYFLSFDLLALKGG